MDQPVDLQWPPPTLDAAIAAIAGRAAEHDADGSFPFEAFEALHPTGALRLTVPRHAGGLGLGLTAAVDLVGRLGAADPAVALVTSQHLLAHAVMDDSVWPAGPLAAVRRSTLDGPALVNSLRVEPDLGTPARGGLPATVAERLADDAGWRLRGHKIYCTGIPMLRWFLVYARTDDAVPAVGSFLVDARTAGYHVERTWATLGMRATRSDDVHFDGAVIPCDHAIGVSTAPLPPSAAMAVWNALLMGVVYHGVARAARDWLTQYLNERTPANLGKPLASLPRVQEAVGRVEVAIATGDQLLAAAAAAGEAAVDGDTARQANLVKHVVTNGAIDVVLEATRLTGNPGLTAAHPLERHVRNAMHGPIHTPQDDTILGLAGRHALEPRPAP